MKEIFIPNNFTISQPTEANVSGVVNMFNNETFIYNVPIHFLSAGIGDFWPMWIYSLVVIAVAVKMKNPLTISFASLISSLALLPIAPPACVYPLMFITAISITASAYLYIKQ